MRDKILVLGIGNYLMGDEGIGVHLARHFRQLPLPVEIVAADSRPDSIHLQRYFGQFKTIIMIYAVLDQQPAGSIRTTRPKCASDFPPFISNFEIGMNEMLPPVSMPDSLEHVWLITVSIAPVQKQTVQLSPAISECLQPLIKKVDKLAHSFLQTEVAL